MYGGRVSLVCRYVSVNWYSSSSGSSSSSRLLKLLGTMPRSHGARIADAQRQRVFITKRADKYSASTVYLQVLGSGAPGAPSTLYLFTDQKRYLFNCGECTQRLAHEHKVKLSRLEHVFITSKTWRNLGGLPGLSLTLQDVGVPTITLHGPPGLDELYKATQRFVLIKDMHVSMAPCHPDHGFEDNVMTVKYVFIGEEGVSGAEGADPAAKRPRLADLQLAEFARDDTDYYRRSPPAHPPDNNHADVPEKTEPLLSEADGRSSCSVAYICTLKKRLGTLDLAACVARGVRPGPLLGRLKAGEDVTLEDGSTVRAQDVKTPDQLGPTFIVLEVPRIEVLREDQFSAHFADEGNPPEDVPALLVHLSPPQVIQHPKYRAFMSRFGHAAQHVVINEHNTCLGSEAAHRVQHKLHVLHPAAFPLLADCSLPAAPPQPATETDLPDLVLQTAQAQYRAVRQLSAEAAEEPEPPELDAPQLVVPRTLTQLHLRPRQGLDRSLEPKLDIHEYIKEAMSQEDFPASLEQLRVALEARRRQRGPAPAPYPRVVFLGTGSCIPSKTRNTSGILLHIDSRRSMILDCGEGTHAQLVRLLGARHVLRVLADLRAIYVSHLHADHHLGLIGLLQARRRALVELGEPARPLWLLAPGQILTWLSLYDAHFEPLRDTFTLVPNQTLLMGESEPAGLSAAALADMGLAAVRTCLVAHCPNAFGVALQVGAHKITYSGDTIPCDSLVALGADSTLLIHEATMEDELADEARAKMHSTTAQAVAQGRRMRAAHTILTHFSQRYARLPRLSADLLRDARVAIAFDNMQVSLAELDELPLLYAPLQLVFAEHCEELEHKAAQRARRRDRASSATPPPPASNTKRCL